MNKKIRNYGITIGCIPTGENNSITDVPGVRVGHITLDYDIVKTGVTAIIPHKGNIFKDKLIGACHIINGFGKSTGLIQIEELGTLETPIILTNTLSVGTAHEALIRYMLNENEDIGDTTGTVNPIICECNDGKINDIRGLHIEKQHIYQAIDNANINFEEGDVGAGKGMICYSLKGGIGSSSRKIILNDKEYIIGVLVLSNFGKLEDFLLDGTKIGERISKETNNIRTNEDKGSIVVILATNIPLSSRQLKRVLKRTYLGIGRTGSFTSNGSGEIVIGFSTGNIIKHYEEEDIISIDIINENKVDDLFKATADATEEAILNSLVCAKPSIDREGNKVYSLKEFLCN